MSDEGSQEIQLRGKQLVFLAMSATVVAVVIFLCGVMVGRGVPTARQAAAGELLEPDPATASSADGADLDAAPAPVEADLAAVPLEYPEIVNDQTGDSPVKSAEAPRQPFSAEPAVARGGAERLGASLTASRPSSAASKPTPVAKPAPRPSAPKTAAKPASAPAEATAAGTQSGFLVQVAAYQREGDATAVRERLKRKGYPAFVTTASTSAGTWFRVRVGSYGTRNEAQAVAARLKREEQLEPWVTR